MADTVYDAGLVVELTSGLHARVYDAGLVVEVTNARSAVYDAGLVVEFVPGTGTSAGVPFAVVAM